MCYCFHPGEKQMPAQTRRQAGSQPGQGLQDFAGIAEFPE
jgi:hypothetical protein